jgi:hypothetical protein
MAHPLSATVLAGLLVSLAAFNANALVPVRPGMLEDASLVQQIARNCHTKYVYAPKVGGRCPSGYFVPGGIGGGQCTKSVQSCSGMPWPSRPRPCRPGQKRRCVDSSTINPR